MKYAQVINGKVVTTQQGIKPVGSEWLAVQVKWQRPSDYPSNFYSPTSNKPRLTVVGNEVHETWGFTLKSVGSIKAEIYRQLTTKRDFMLFGDIVSDGMTITVRDERDIQVVTNMGDLPVRFKRGTGDRISLTAAQAMDFRLVYEAKVQTAFDWEESEEDKVGALLTHDELKAYLESN